MPAEKVLIANRGEIAMRIANACRALGHDIACVYTAADEHSGHVALARQIMGGAGAFRISSYQDANEIMAVADHCGATAVHPGYGFFAEDFRFARRVVTRQRAMRWLGPSWEAIRELGDKIATKRLARRLGVPTVPGSDRPIYDELEAEEIAASLFAFQAEQGIDKPLVLIKASAGGGGMGIEEVERIDQFRGMFRRLRNYAKRQFHDEGVLIEQRVLRFNHLEVQVLGDGKSEPVHFGTRNCSVQSTGRQKRIEVAPGFAPKELSYTFNAAKLLEDITRHSLSMAREVSYDSVGTWEWIVTPRGEPFLMEVNTRIQVENGVSGIIASANGNGPVDLIAEQVRVGLGQAIGYSQNEIGLNGVGIEYRIIAEDPDNRFAPWVGRIDEFHWPEQDWLDVYTQVPTRTKNDEPYQIPTQFDPNLALAIIKGDDLEQAKARGKAFLESLVLTGMDRSGGSLKSNIEFLKRRTANLLEFSG